jgi:hypothetical protein
MVQYATVASQRAGGRKLYNLVCAYPVLEYILLNPHSTPHAVLTSAMQGELGGSQLEGKDVRRSAAGRNLDDAK